MADLSSFQKTDLVDDHLAADYNRLLGGVLRAEFVNTETISDTKELADSDCQFQVITASGADRTVELAPESTTNHVTLIYNAGATYNVVVKDDSGSTTLATLAPDEWTIFWPVYGEGWKAFIDTDTDTDTDTVIQMSSASPRVYTSNDTWSKPSGLAYVIVEVVGGGGGGGGVSAASSQAAFGGNGGGGEYAKKRIDAGDLGSTETVTIGAAGTAGSAGNNNGGNGGNSSFGSHVAANGGSGGEGQAASTTVPRAGGAPGAGGTGGSGGDIIVPGDSGEPNSILSILSAANACAGGNVLGGRVRTSGVNVAGATGAAYGGGGSGARTQNDTTDRAGGAGAAGVVIVWEYVEVDQLA